MIDLHVIWTNNLVINDLFNLLDVINVQLCAITKQIYLLYEWLFLASDEQ